MRKIENNRSLKILSVAALIGTVALGTPAMAGVNNSHPEVVSGANKQGAVTGFAADVVLGTDESAEVLKNKPVDTPTLDYLHQNNVLIPQKGEYNTTDKTWSEADPIEAPESAYKITAGTEADHTFDYTTADKDGNLTHNYYKIELKPSVTLGTSDHIEWKKLETAPAEGTPNTISIKVSDTETLYYSYEYTKPSNYEETSTRINDTLTTENSQYKVFTGITGNGNGGAIYNAQDNSSVNIIADFINNSANTYGSAIYNRGTLGNIIGDFISNSSTYGGGAITNDRNSTIGNITGDFINNSANIIGGAIMNSNSSIGNITGNFISNTVTSSHGGAIYNVNGTIGNITGDFIGNHAGSQGGAIYNTFSSNISNITGNFISNSAGSHGGAIYNNDSSTIGNVTGDFINNSTNSYGGAIFNYNSTVGDLTGDFIGNHAALHGGAIYNFATTEGSIAKIGNITGNFISNTASNSGGAIYNANGTIGNITGDFVNNSATKSQGGAIYNNNSSNISNITGNFISNSAGSHGGAIYNNNSSTLGNVTGDFINNSTNTNGGAIFNYNSTVGDITGDFIGNHAGSTGGAIYNNAATEGSIAKIGNITGNFIANTAGNSGGAIYHFGDWHDTTSSSIGDINGNFINNSVLSEKNTNVQGGAIMIMRAGKIGDINGSFIGNQVTSTGGAFGGAISLNMNWGSVKSFNGDFIRNKVVSHSSGVMGGAIYQYQGNLENINSNFIENTAIGASGYGGAIMSDSAKIGIVKGDFISNSLTATVSDAQGGAIGTIWGNKIDLLESNFVDNYVQAEGIAKGGAIANTSKYAVIDKINGDFIKNRAESKSNVSHGGAIFNEGTIGTILNSNFLNNYAKSESGTAQGGAIYSTTDLNIIADGATSTFRGNYTQTGEDRDDNAIYADNAATINFETKNNGRIDMYDNIRGASIEQVQTDADGNELLDADGNKLTTTKNYSVNITGDNTGTFGMYNDIYNANVSMGNTTINTLNNLTHTYNFNSLTLTGNTNFIADVDLKNKQMDRFTAASYGEHQGNLNVVGMNLLSDATSDKTEVFFAEQGLKNNVTSNVSSLPNKQYQTAYTPIYKYNVTYNNKPDGGYFVFQRGSNGGNSSDAFNPSVLASPVSTTAATQATVNETFKYVFEHADAFTQLPSVERISRINLNKYALNQEKYNGYSTDYNTNLGSLNPTLNNKAGWFRPYVTFENMHLNHGPKVNAITYGSLVGYDTDFNEHKHGWYSVGTGYIGYNGSQLNYSNTDTTMNGGLLGYTHTFYKGNFWSALTATAGASVGESKSMYGKENFTTLLAGIGSKTGYNFEFKKGKFIVQPIMFMSYTFANTFDYTNAAGVKINNSPAHSIQLNPSVRFIANTKNNWQPYASVGMVWNVMNENKVTANNVRLPEMSMKPYVEYGLGLQRNWKDKFTAFGQAMIRNGGRNGIALTAGFRWSLGKEGKGVNEKVMNPSKNTVSDASQRNRTVLKQLTPTQKTALGAKPQNTTRTTNSAILKQL